MFTQYMTDEELEAAAYRDFLEIRMKVQLAYEQFIRQQQFSVRRQRVIHSLMEEKKVTTRSKNTWHVLFINSGYTPANDLLVGSCIYTRLHRGEEVDYLFINNTENFLLDRLSTHFLMRYKQRYLEYNGINLRGIHPAIYYMMHNQDISVTYYLPENWTEKDIAEKAFMISKQGLSLVKFSGHMITYITFLDQENLSRYKAMIFEEETLWKDIESMRDLDLTTERKHALYMKYSYDREHSRMVMERCLRRIGDKEKITEEVLQGILDQFEDLLVQTLAVENTMMQTVQKKSFEMPDIESYLEQMKKGK